ncbi:MAG: SLC13 family permease [Pyrinomonadaceae bacterium]
MSESVRVLEVLSKGEERFEQWRRRAGMVIAPLAFLVVLALPPDALKPEAHRLAAVMAAVMVLWISEALPMPVTALLGAAACVVLRVAPAREVFASFADPLIFLFIGSFILAQAIFYHRLDRRVAFGVLSISWIGARPARILLAFGAVTAFISAWISNTATTAMMFPIGLSIINFLFSSEEKGGRPVNRGYATALMLITAFGASIGGFATPVGTPTNVVGIGFIRRLLGVDLSFFKWAMIGAPVAVCLFAFLYLYLNRLCPAGVAEIEGSREMIAREKRSLGSWTRGQKSVLVAFGVTVLLWVVPGIIALALGEESVVYQNINRSMPEAVPAMIGAGLLFLLPGDRGGGRAITWGEAVKIDWGVVLLFGGGLTFGVLSFQTGLAEWAGRGLTGALSLHGTLGMLGASVVVAAVMSETTSNVASANMVIPVVVSMAQAAGVDPLEPTLGAALGASLGFMLPVSTPCNAIVYGSGHVPLMRMVRYGLLLDVVGIIVIIVLVHLLVPFVR